MAQVEIIIPNWNGRELLRACLDSLRAQTYPDFKIIVVDNASSDGSVEFLQRHYPEVELLELPENRGFAGGINAGIRAGTAPYLCWFNNDAEAAPDFLEKLLNELIKVEGKGFGFAAPRICLHSDHNTLNSAGIFIGQDGIARERGFLRPNAAPYDQPQEVFGPAGAAALFRRELFERTGLLDEDYFMYGDEDDLSYRAQLLGYRCLYVPGAVAYHQVSASSRKVRPQTAQRASRNSLTTILKNMPLPLVLAYSPAIITGQFYQLARFGQQGVFIPALMGKLDAMRLLAQTLKKRHIVQKTRLISLTDFRARLKLGRNLPRFLETRLKGH
ncbi:MAG: glycosyltransferase family 2 protein [Chloroflexi bacterium]|uniref:Glycosyltransferase n=1 Tax=Candidatus Chlorohelix allophototropha TaxID=3003348 RepID=A0A8T7M6V4_9CHLR|nr:glycosyltransferase family 2 protein [Chloroflexota bacterium]WJW69752.1 glycosyltransferase [Chloroflexota bacterium L227-S17]